MTTSLIDLVNQLREARLRQADAKERLLQATADHHAAKNDLYLEALGNKCGHFEALALANNDAKVRKLLRAVNEAQLEHYRLWVEAAHLVGLITVQRDLPADVIENYDCASPVAD